MNIITYSYSQVSNKYHAKLKIYNKRRLLHHKSASEKQSTHPTMYTKVNIQGHFLNITSIQISVRSFCEILHFS